MINGYVTREISDFFILDKRRKGTGSHSVKVVMVRRELLKYSFHRGLLNDGITWITC